MMSFCYVLLEYPVLSQTFVVDEIRALRDAGARVLTVSLEGGSGADVALGSLRASSPRVAVAAAALLLRRPRALVALLRGPLTFGLRLKLLAAAGAARAAGVSAVHAHFAYRSADGAEVIGRALGTGHSLTVHAHDLFVHDGPVDRRLRAARTVITVCDYNRRWLAEHHGDAAAGRVHVVPCCTRVERNGADPGSRPPVPTILAVGRLVPKKGIDVLLHALHRLTGEVRLVVIGEGPERERLVALAARLGVDDRVAWLGGLTHDDVLTHMRSATLFCVPFRVAPDGDRDSMPVVVKEAMAAGLPVVSTREVGVPEMIEHDVDGLLVPPDDPVALATALERALSDADLRRRLASAARRTVAERFDIRDQAQALMEILG